jgi:AP2 domain
MEELIVDPEDFDHVEQFTWYLDTHTGYWRRTVDGLPIHNFLMGSPPQGCTWDHKDRDKNNNSRSNLRIATWTQQFGNVEKRHGNFTSQYKGVYHHGRNQRWIAQIKIDGRAKYLGSFVSEEAAAQAYDEAAREWFGEFANPNFR